MRHHHVTDPAPFLQVKEGPRIVTGTLVPEKEVRNLPHSKHSIFQRKRRAYRYYPSRFRLPRPFPRSLAVILVVAIASVLLFFLPSLFVHSVSTTIVLRPREGEETRVITVVALPDDPHQLQRSVRVQTQNGNASIRVQTTGIHQQSATNAQGTLTFYNTTTQGFSLPAGVDIAATTGIHVTTMLPVSLPPSPNFPQFSTATVPARATVAGILGNLALSSINTQCPPQYCGENKVTITNTSPFAGGQNTQIDHIVAQTDIDTAAAPFLASLPTATLHALLTHQQPGDKLVENTLSCPASHITAVPPLGTSAPSVLVSVDVTCQGEMYQPKEIMTRALAQFHARVSSFPASTLHEITESATIASPVDHDAQGKVSFLVTIWRKWKTSIDPAFVSGLAIHLVGMTPDQAQRYIHSNRTIGKVVIHQQFIGGLPLFFPCSLADAPEKISVHVSS